MNSANSRADALPHLKLPPARPSRTYVKEPYRLATSSGGLTIPKTGFTMAILGIARRAPPGGHRVWRSNMKKADLKVFRDQLLGIRARLRGDVTSMASAALRKSGAEGSESSMPIHMAELGSDNFEQEFTLSLLANEEDRLGMIETALQRIEEGAYGQCEECGGVIAKTRLIALPYTPVCIKCAESRDNGGYSE